jgi:hypothetical protein
MRVGSVRALGTGCNLPLASSRGGYLHFSNGTLEQDPIVAHSGFVSFNENCIFEPVGTNLGFISNRLQANGDSGCCCPSCSEQNTLYNSLSPSFIPLHTCCYAAPLASNCLPYSTALPPSSWSVGLSISPLSSFSLEAASLLKSAAWGLVDEDQTNEWRSSLVRTFRGLTSKETIGQHHFWRVYDFVDFSSFSDKSVAGAVRAYRDSPDWEFHRDISARNIRGIVAQLIRELEDYEVRSAADILALLRTKLKKEVSSRVTWRGHRTSSDSSCSASSTHNLVHAFLIHTGNSPPAVGTSRPAVRRALVPFTNAPEVGDETVRRRKAPANLRNALRSRRTRAHLCRSTRANAYFDRCQDPSRCSYYGPNTSLAQYA